jgi:hypothetical protein
MARSRNRQPDMAEMSPLGSLILRAMRAGAIAAAGFVVLAIGIELWKLWRFEGSTGNYGFLVILAAMLFGFLWLARAITREIRLHRS